MINNKKNLSATHWREALVTLITVRGFVCTIENSTFTIYKNSFSIDLLVPQKNDIKIETYNEFLNLYLIEQRVIVILDTAKELITVKVQ